MKVDEQGGFPIRVDIPVGGAGGQCNPKDFDRQGNTLTLTERIEQQIGACSVQVDVTTVLNFNDDLSVWGFERSTLTALGGDCDGLGLPCTVELTLDGLPCTGCFDCVPAARGAGRTGLGLLGAGAGVAIDTMRARVGG
jgi:hypothetical protein